MLPVRIGIASRSTLVKLSDLVPVANALTMQLSRDVGPIWSVTGTVVALPDPDRIDPGVWPIYILDEIADDVAGFHKTEHNQPLALVEVGDSWSLSCSHEMIEMVIDPSGDKLVSSNAIGIVDDDVQDVNGKFEYLLEACDPVEGQTYAYMVDGVLVSDFYTPNYFDPVGTGGVRYSFSGKITRPREVLDDGYLSWFNPQAHKLQQLRRFGAPVIVDLADVAPGTNPFTTSIRSFVDRVTPPRVPLARLPGNDPKVVARDARDASLTAAARPRADMFATAATSVLARATAAAAVPLLSDGTVAAAIDSNLAQLQKPGVLSIRPGISLDQPGKRKVIVVGIDPARFGAVAATLPAQVGSIPVEARAASPLVVLRATQPLDYVLMADKRHELRLPQFTGEKLFDLNGQPQTDPAAAVAAFAASKPPKPHIDYKPPAGKPLDPVSEQMTLILHASPDAGWEELAKFIADVKGELVVGIYDFTSKHILDALVAALNGDSLTLTLDHPAKNPTADQTDEETQRALSTALGARLKSAWALTDYDKLAPVWIYPNAYHIKVAVRDDDVFWLSSGNWNNSNQPVIDITDVAAAKKIAAKSDRDWHVIAKSSKLADLFRAYLKNDYKVAHTAESKTGPSTAMLATAAFPDVPIDLFAVGRRPTKFFTSKTLTGNFTVQPLLTPDNYKDHVGPLIESAKRTFYMQTQYIHPSGKAGDEEHDALIARVAALVKAGVDVKLINSQYEDDNWVEKVVAADIPRSVLRRQTGVHNKGIIVDSAVVMISSQNWSADGTLRNRDAGLIISDADAAAYFEEVFLHDWNNLATPV